VTTDIQSDVIYRNLARRIINLAVGKVELRKHFQGEVWGRMPKPKERLQGLSRTTLLELSYAGLIRSVVIRKPGAQKGIRLVYLPSLFAYLDSLEPEGTERSFGVSSEAEGQSSLRDLTTESPKAPTQ
jgi:hypothetical protein